MSETLVANKYRILRRLASGGMGEVCLAAQEGPAGYERMVALKRMLPNLTTNSDVLRLFLDEARLVAQLNHRNICQIIELGEDADGYFVAMEFISGTSVYSLLDKLRTRGERFDPYYAVDVAAQVAEALSYAYTAPGSDGQPLRIIHRDVSPHNVLLSTAGDVKLIDFGVAKSSQQQHSTEAGTIKGKMGYLSPEQSQGKELDGRSDLFSVGIVLYEMVAGANPFAKPDLVAMIRSIQSEEVPPLSSLNPSWATLDSMLSRLLAKSPEARFPDANAAAEALLDLRQTLPRPPKRLGPYVSECFGEELAALAKSITDSKMRVVLEKTFERAQATPSAPVMALPIMSAEARSVANLPTQLKALQEPAATGSGLTSSELAAMAAQQSRLPRVLSGAALLVMAGLAAAYWISAPAPIPPPATPLVAVTPPLAPPPAPAPARVVEAPKGVEPLASKDEQLPSPEARDLRDHPHPVPLPPAGEGTHPGDRASVGVGATPASKRQRKPEAPTALVAPLGPTPPEPASAPVVLGTLRIAGAKPHELSQATGHVDLQDPGAHYRLGLDYTITNGRVRARMSSTPWAIVSIDGQGGANTKEKAVELPQLGGAPVRIELVHPDMEKVQLVLTYDPR